MQLGGRARLDVDVGAARSRLTPAEMVDHGTIDTKPGGSGLLDHPQQWIFRRTASVFRIAAADVGVHAGKPDLADVLIHRGGRIEDIGTIFLRLDPAVEPKHPAPFIDRIAWRKFLTLGLVRV